MDLDEEQEDRIQMEQQEALFTYVEECKSKGENVLYSEVLKIHPDSVFFIPMMQKYTEYARGEGLGEFASWMDNHLIIDDESFILEERILRDPNKAATDPKSILTD